MKVYDVTIVENNILWWKNIVGVTVENNEHPSRKAIDFICKNGYMREPEHKKIIKIKRIS